jgi:hypothetical protein
VIVDLLLFRLKDQLTANLPEVNVIKVGRFQQNPLENPKYLAINTGNSRNDSTVDGIVSLGDMQNISMRIPGREVGGGSYWWRRGIIDIGYYGVAEGKTEEQTQIEAFAFLGKVQHWTELTRVADLTDEYGEHAIQIFVYSSTYTESGGPENQYIYRGQLHWQVLTARR